MLDGRVARVAVVAVALVVVTAVGPVLAGADLMSLLPAPDTLEFWSIAESPTEYVPGTLWEYLNGGATRYVGFGFRRLVHVRYQLGDDPLASVTLDVFDMGGELGAFGIYRAGLPAEATGVDTYVD